MPHTLLINTLGTNHKPPFWREIHHKQREREMSGLVLPALPALVGGDLSSMRGPCGCSNWVVPGRVLCGAFPGNIHGPTHDANVDALLMHRMDTLVCLLDRFNPGKVNQCPPRLLSLPPPLLSLGARRPLSLSLSLSAVPLFGSHLCVIPRERQPMHKL